MKAILLMGALLALAACNGGNEVGNEVGSDESDPATTGSIQQPVPGQAADLQPGEKRALFGDLHVHTSWSTDAYAAGNRVGPADAYRFARGEAIDLPTGVTAQLAVPLDFVAITDHAEGFDAVAACTFSDHPDYESDYCQNMRSPQRGQAGYLEDVFARRTARPALRDPGLCGDDADCMAWAKTTWQRTRQVANDFNQPGEFTTLIGYEFSSLLDNFGMLHRNVIFRGTEVIPFAISSLEVDTQRDFFRQLDEACNEPCQVLTIPHNTNYSWGMTFSRQDEDGADYSRSDLERWMAIDRLVEITQQKGTSECQLGVGAADEDCDFGILFPACSDTVTERCIGPQSMVRDTLIDGLVQEDEGGLNPFRYGVIGSTDNHNSDAGNTNPERPSRYARAIGDAEAVNTVFERVHVVAGPYKLMNDGGLAGVWATENTREAVWDALYRRETFATSGTRMKVRLVAGDDVPMGSEYPAAAPRTFRVEAMQDPGSASLDRVQVIKGWVEDGVPRHRIWDVACSGGRELVAGQCPATTASVDTETCERADDTGASMLATQFTDPDAREDDRAFYYLRVFENPSCRWSTYLAHSAGVAPPADVPLTVQNRAWSSPVWVVPTAD